MAVASGVSARAADRDHLLADEVLIENVGEPVEKMLRPVFDQIWNAFGYPRSLNYDRSGNWLGQR
jgi:hypothetical protein